MNILDVLSAPTYDNTVEGIEFHSYKPYVTSFNRNDEIRIPINQQDLYVLPSASTLYLEGTVIVSKKDSKDKASSVHFTNNALLYLFQDIRYELNGVEIDKIKNAGVTTTMKSLISMNESESKISNAWGWNIDGTKNVNGGNFSASIPLCNIMGFAEDFKKVVINSKHELILLRSNTNLNAVKLSTGEIVDDVQINKIIWRVPHVKVSDKEKINLLKLLEKDRPLQMIFRNWDLYEYPALPKTTKHTWSIKTSSQIEKPRYVIIGLQTNRKNNAGSDMSQFDHCYIRDVRVYLNSTYFPYENLNASFSNNKIALIYEQYTRFQQSYYGRRSEPLLSEKQFKDLAPLFVVDCSRQADNLKTGPVVDVRVEIESELDIPDQTSAYCLILNDCIIEYKPLSNIVRKIS
nr:TPA_asm: hexon [Spodoptera moth adintovirus 1]